jgi:NitT/TauT family transport system permease protein
VSELLTVRGNVPDKTKTLIEFLGLVLFVLVWQLIVSAGWITSSILPYPAKVVTGFTDMLQHQNLVGNTIRSLQLNGLAYLEAVLLSIPLGFVIGLLPVFRSLSERLIAAARYLPITALTGVFIGWLGIEMNMKVQFLFFGIVVYLLPVVVQRVDEVQEVFIQTAKTCGATSWQMVKDVMLPDVLRRVYFDIIVLVPISWTYICVAETLNATDGGLGAMAYTAGRQSQTGKVYAILVIITLIGFALDKGLNLLGRVIFPSNYVGEMRNA